MHNAQIKLLGFTYHVHLPLSFLMFLILISSSNEDFGEFGETENIVLKLKFWFDHKKVWNLHLSHFSIQVTLVFCFLKKFSIFFNFSDSFFSILRKTLLAAA